MATIDRIQRQIEYCRSIIERATTGAGERAAAEQAIARLRTKLEGLDPNEIGDRDDRDRYYRLRDRVYGTRYAQTQDLTLTQIAKLIRTDIKFAKTMAANTAGPGDIKLPDPIGDAPRQIRISVTTQYYSGGGSIDITLRDIPREWGFAEQDDPYLSGATREMPTADLRTFAAALREIADTYNYDGSDPTVDYFDRRFWGSVATEDGLNLA